MMKVTANEESNILISLDSVGMVKVTNKDTGRTFHLTKNEAKQLSTLLKLVVSEESSNPPEDQL